MIIKGSCHCKGTTFEVAEAPRTVTQCTCSFCSKRGSLWAYYVPSQFKLTSPLENVSFYRWGSKTITWLLRCMWLRHLHRNAGLVDWQAGFRQPEDQRQFAPFRRFRSGQGRSGGHRWHESVVEARREPSLGFTGRIPVPFFAAFHAKRLRKG